MASKDELGYFAFLLFSVIFGWIVGRLPAGAPRLWLSSGIGLLAILLFCGSSCLHTFFTIVVNALIVTKLRDCHKWSFAFCFGYLAFFRTAEHFGLPETTEFSNAVQLILTLKAVGVAFEINDTQLRRKGLSPFASSSPNFSPTNTYANVDPGFVNIIHYCLCFMGIMTGPYFKYKTFDDMINSDILNKMPREKLALQRMRILPFYCGLFLTLSAVFNISTLYDEIFYATTNAPYRFLVVMALFVWFRMKFYIAWVLAESACIAAGLGIYPAICKPKPGHGPTEPEKIPVEVDEETEYSFETIYNIDEYAVEFVPTVREALKSWNMTVQYWLAWHVYRRVPMKSIRTVVVMFVSAYWHGLHGGYYLSLLTVPLMLMAESWISRYDSFGAKFANWFLRMRAFEYMSVGFMCLTGARTWRYWSSLYFAGHIIAVVVFVAGQVYRKMTRAKRHAAVNNKAVNVEGATGKAHFE
ncbi:lysophospholipid acyltransferase 7-like [Paramacrobiotus metropolitanus]|uniref:lysophospholipid acyltransferase 7-like n=1 Tax=Paramacrobiotus metropolitanus TaxID=2943436 RepID=UPI00244576F6|nr:lysophospholipid acyltransferase 7-like [Paramacrobiotus metropolitanus]XP_055337430.1 lysophospholipid acyltransferase 7-like [Paramacrobiotus metropolitanus]